MHSRHPCLQTLKNKTLPVKASGRPSRKTVIEPSAPSSTDALSQENWNENGREERASSTLPALRRWEVGSRVAQVPSAPRHPSRLLSVLTERGAQASLPPPSRASLGEARSQPALPVPGRCRVPRRTRPKSRKAGVWPEGLAPGMASGPWACEARPG